MKVYDNVRHREFKWRGQGKLIKERRLDVNKGDSTKPDIRSRYACKKFATGVDASLYASTLALEALKMLAGHASCHKGKDLHIMLSDVKRA